MTETELQDEKDGLAQANGSGNSQTGREPVRSQNPYPYHDLRQAIRFTEAVQDAGGNEAREDDVLKALGLKYKASRAWTYRLGSALQFKVITKTRGPDSRIKLTELGKRLLLPASPEEHQATKVNALQQPRLYQQLLAKYASSRLPPVENLSNLLKRDYGLVDSACVPAAQAFLDTLEFAGVVKNGVLDLAQVKSAIATASGEDQGSEDAPAEEVVSADDHLPQDKLQKPRTIAVPADFMIHHFQLRKGMVITIALPADLTKKDVDRMSTWLKFNLFDDDEG